VVDELTTFQRLQISATACSLQAGRRWVNRGHVGQEQRQRYNDAAKQGAAAIGSAQIPASCID
jgi:hypothetical protein